MLNDMFHGKCMLINPSVNTDTPKQRQRTNKTQGEEEVEKCPQVSPEIFHIAFRKSFFLWTLHFQYDMQNYTYKVSVLFQIFSSTECYNIKCVNFKDIRVNSDIFITPLKIQVFRTWQLKLYYLLPRISDIIYVIFKN